jgi:hypothetical protein
MNDTVGLKILSAKEFEVKIKTMMKESSLTMIDSIVHYCQMNGLEIETAASLISPRMKSEIESEAISSRMIISKKARLPI